MIISASSYGDIPLPAGTVCIIGAGAAGIALACELDGCSFPVLLLDAGGLRPDSGLGDFYRGAADDPHLDPAQYRSMGFGGTTATWGGRCVPLDPIDFERRDYVPNSGWPIGYGELARFYPRALEYCDAGKFDFTATGSIREARPSISAFDGRGVILHDCIERYSPPTHFGRCFRTKIESSTNVMAVLNARCVKLNKRAGQNHIESVVIVDRAGKRRNIHAEWFVLATGGIETTRLLLASDTEGPGFGNHHDKLGRYYACHFENLFGKLVSQVAVVKYGFERTYDGVYCRRKLLFTPRAQHQHRLLNSMFRLHHSSYADATHGHAAMSIIYLAKSGLLGAIPTEYAAFNATVGPSQAHLKNVLAGVPQLLSYARDYLFRTKLAKRKLPYTLLPNAGGNYPLEFNSEQTPLESSRITLGHDADAHGLRRVHIQWRMCEADIDSACRAFELLRETVNHSRGVRLEFDENQLRERMSESLPLGGHHLGTARMAATAREGVVDRNSALFELPNLFVASSAVFPTNGHANPTLTIVALAVRMAEHLRKLASATSRG
jgi:choline dehydrogenase-like flavoprotein